MSAPSRWLLALALAAGCNGAGAPALDGASADTGCGLLLPQTGCPASEACYVAPGAAPMCAAAGEGKLGSCMEQPECAAGFFCEPGLMLCCPFCPASEVGNACDPLEFAGHTCCPRRDLPAGVALCFPTASVDGCPDR